MIRGALRLLALAVVLAGAVQLGINLSQDDPPDEGSADVGFARAMRTHHAQAVELAELLRERTSNQDLRVVAADIALTQQSQIGQMRGWLDAWGLSPTSTDPPMAWAEGHTDGEMPGLASDSEVDQLSAARGEDAEVLFLQLMIRHHEGGVHMALLATELVHEGEVQALARTIADGQQAEIRYLKALLTARDAEPLPSLLPADVTDVADEAPADDRQQEALDFLGRWWLVGLAGLVLVVLVRDLVRGPPKPVRPSIAPSETPVATVTDGSDEQPDREDDRHERHERHERRDDRDDDLDRFPSDDSSFDDV